MIPERFEMGITHLMLMTVGIIAIRLIPLLTGYSVTFLNFTPLGAFVLFGSVYLKGNIKPFLFPLVVLFISDVVLCYTVYGSSRQGILYPNWWWVYMSFLIIVLIGKIIVRNVTFKNLTLAVVVSTITHWLVSNIGDCMKAPDVVQSFLLYKYRLISALSFELYFLVGTLIYAFILFGSIEWIFKRSKTLEINVAGS